MLTYRDSFKEITPDNAIQLLKSGNERFTNGISLNRDLLRRVEESKNEQKPFAAVLSCMDSRAPAELIFDQGIGDIFNIRIAGNVVFPSILGSLEYAVAVAGVKLIVVMGHTGCGAIKGACDNVELGNITKLLSYIKGCVEEENTVTENRTGSNIEFVNKVSRLNISNSHRQLLEQSDILKKSASDNEIKIISSMYDVNTGHVHFYDEQFL